MSNRGSGHRGFGLRPWNQSTSTSAKCNDPTCCWIRGDQRYQLITITSSDRL